MFCNLVFNNTCNHSVHSSFSKKPLSACTHLTILSNQLSMTPDHVDCNSGREQEQLNLQISNGEAKVLIKQRLVRRFRHTVHHLMSSCNPCHATSRPSSFAFQLITAIGAGIFTVFACRTHPTVSVKRLQDPRAHPAFLSPVQKSQEPVLTPRSYPAGEAMEFPGIA